MNKNLRYLVGIPLIAGTLAGCASNPQRNYSSQDSQYRQIQERNTSKESALEKVGPCIGMGLMALPMIVLGGG